MDNQAPKSEFSMQIRMYSRYLGRASGLFASKIDIDAASLQIERKKAWLAGI
jgi:hypothetical protein